jgi:hypothetical protein
MADGLIPDFSPEAYTSGQGTGYAQVFNLQGPNPFETTQNTYDKLLAIQKDSLKKSYENEEKRQEKLDDFLSSIHDYDNAWEMGKVQLGKEIDTYGNLISGMRAQGKAIDVNTLNKSKKKIADLAKANEDNQKNYAKIAAIMADPIVYTDEERKKFQDEVKAEANIESGGDVFKVQDYLSKWSASLATPDILSDYIKLKPEAKSDKSGYIKETVPGEAQSVVNSIWSKYEPIQQKKLLSDMLNNGEIKADIVNTAKDEEGNIDLQNSGLNKEVQNALLNRVKPFFEKDVTPKPVYRSSSSNSTEKSPFNINAAPVAGFPQDEMRTISLSNPKGGNVEPRLFKTRRSGNKNMIPSYMEYLNKEQAGENPAGWYVFGKEAKEPSSKEIKPGESEEFVIEAYQKENKLNSDEFQYKKDGNKITFYKLVDAIAPYDLNIAEMKGYGVESLEAVAAQQKFKKIAGVSGGWNPNGN